MNQHQNDLYQEARMAVVIEQQEVNLFSILRPKVFIDGNKYCVLYGEDLQTGIAGFGDTIMGAIYDFNKSFNKPVKKQKNE